MIRGGSTTECLGQMAGEFVEPVEAQNMNDECGPDVHDENRCAEGKNDGESRGYDRVEHSMFNSFVRLREVRKCS